MSERTYKLQKGDQVVMHTCMEHDHPNNFGKIWTCRSDEFQHKGHDYGSIFLEGFSGSFSTEFLQKVDVSALVDSLQQQLTERDRTIARLTKELEEARRNLNIQQAKIKMLEVDNEMLESMVGQEREDDNDEAVRLRKALEDAREAFTHLTGEHPTELWTKSEIDGWRGTGESAIDNINQALGRE